MVLISEQMLLSISSYVIRVTLSTFRLNLVHFSVTWTPSCAQLNEILAELAKTLSDPFNVAQIDAEAVPEASLESGVTAAPTIVYFKVHRRPVKAIQLVSLRTERRWTASTASIRPR